MADDVRPRRDLKIKASADSSRSGTEVTQDGKTYQTFGSPVGPDRSVNLMEGGTEHTAGGQVKAVSFTEAAKTIKLEDFTSLHTKPCVRDALIRGLAAGFGIGGVRAVLGGSIMRVCNWAVGGWLFGSAASYEYCLQRRQYERDGVKRAVELLDQKAIEREKKMQAARVARREAKEAAEKAEEEALKQQKQSSWKFW